MKVIICGSRDWNDIAIIRSWLAKLQDWGYDTIIEGGAKGADTIAREEADRIGMNIIEYPAEWQRYGKTAGSIRNRKMLKEKPDLVLAFHPDISESERTKNMVDQAKKAGINIIVITEKNEPIKGGQNE